MHAMLSNNYKRKLCCMVAGAPAAFQSENTRVHPPIIDVFHVRSSNTARHTKCISRQTRRGSASPQSAHTSSLLSFQRIATSPCSANFKKFGVRGQVTNAIMCVKFLVNQFRGYRVLTPTKLPFLINLLCCPYNSVRPGLPCDTVII